MAYTALREVTEKIQNLEEFKGNSIRAEFCENPYTGAKTYVVYSYGTPILGISMETEDGEEYADECIINKTGYSVTTSRHQNLVQRAVDYMLTGLSAREIYDLPRGDVDGFMMKFA